MACVAVRDARYIGEYRVRLPFNAGEVGEVDRGDEIFAYKTAESLLDPVAFAAFQLD